MKGFFIAALAALLLAPISPARGQAGDGDDIWRHQINKDTAGNWSVQPDRPRPAFVDSEGVPGGVAMRVRVRRQGVNPWDVQVSSPIAGAINRGDVILLMFYARAEVAAEGGSTLPAHVQLAAAPYTTVINSNEGVTGEWAQHCAFATAQQDIAAGQANVVVHLASAEQTIDLGPVLVFNFGAGFDQSKLPNCEG
jgi:hypothetical protein